MAKKYIKMYSKSLFTSKMQINTTVRYHFAKVRLHHPKNPLTINAGEDVQKRKSSYTVGRNLNW